MKSHTPQHNVTTRGFTLLEILFSVLILGILIGLLFFAFGATRTFALGTGDKAAIAAVRMGVTRFVDDFGFVPPLVRDQATNQPRSVTNPGGRFSVIATYDLLDPADQLRLRPVGFVAIGNNNPFSDDRYSLRTLPYYLIGALDLPFEPSATDATARTLPIDGFAGPGFYKPRESGGTFVVPATVRRGNAATSRRGAGQRYESLIDLGTKGLNLYWYARDAGAASNGAPEPLDGDAGADPENARWVELRDRNNRPIRFYAWLNGAAYNVNGQDVFEIRTLDDYRIPRLVGRLSTEFPGTPPDRDIERNLELRRARWAIVAAGPDGAFGDEPLAELLRSLGVPTVIDERAARIAAEKDNIIEVGE
jgi:prepilin-type N-terminal cleavage/methylation domain-containing protein